MMEGREEDPMPAALNNQIVLREIFSSLEIIDLKRCRLVHKFWDFEITSYMREFLRCDASISGDDPCSTLNDLNQLASGMNPIVPINSLTITLNGRGHSESKSSNKSNIYNEIVNNLDLKYLGISWEPSFQNVACPAVRFTTNLFRQKISQLHTLSFEVDPEFWNYFVPVWTPPCLLPKLKVLDLGGQKYQFDDRAGSVIILKIIEHAPNLKELGGTLGCDIVDVIPEQKYQLIKRFSLSIDSNEDETKCRAFAETEPKLSALDFGAPLGSKRQHMPAFLRVLQHMLTSSCKTLKQLLITTENFPLKLITFPPLANVTKLIVYTPDNSILTLNALRSIDYPRMLPALAQIHAERLRFDDYPYDTSLHPWLNARSLNPLVEQHSSTTVTDLLLAIDWSPCNAVYLSEIYPNLCKLDTTNMSKDVRRNSSKGGLDGFG